MEIISKPKQSVIQARKIYNGNQNLQLIDSADVFVLRNLDQQNVNSNLTLSSELQNKLGEQDLKAVYINSKTGDNNLLNKVDVVEELKGKVIQPSNVIIYNPDNQQNGYNLNEQCNLLNTYISTNDIKNNQQDQALTDYKAEMVIDQQRQDTNLNNYKTSNDAWQVEQDERLDELEDNVKQINTKYHIGEYVFVWNDNMGNEIVKNVIKADRFKTLVNTRGFLNLDTTNQDQLLNTEYIYPEQNNFKTVTSGDKQLKIIQPLPTCFLAGNDENQYYNYENPVGTFTPYKQFSKMINEYQVNYNADFRQNKPVEQITYGYNNFVNNSCLFQKGVFIFRTSSNNILKFHDYELLPLNTAYYLCIDDINLRYGTDELFNWWSLKTVQNNQSVIYGYNLKTNSFNQSYDVENDIGVKIYICFKVVNENQIIKYDQYTDQTFQDIRYLGTENLIQRDSQYFEKQFVFCTKNNKFDFRLTSETKSIYFNEFSYVVLAYINANQIITYSYYSNYIYGYEAVLNNMQLIGQIKLNKQNIAANTENITNNTTTINYIDTQQNTNSQNIASLQTQQNTNTTNITNLQTGQTNMQTDIGTIYESLNNKQSGIEINAANIATLQQKATTAENNITNLQTAQTTDEANITTLQNQQIANDSSINSLQTQQTTNTTNITNLQTQQSTNTTNITNLQNQVTTNTSSIANLQTQQTINTNNITTNTNSINTINTTLANLSSGSKKLKYNFMQSNILYIFSNTNTSLKDYVTSQNFDYLCYEDIDENIIYNYYRTGSTTTFKEYLYASSSNTISRTYLYFLQIEKLQCINLVNADDFILRFTEQYASDYNINDYYYDYSEKTLTSICSATVSASGAYKSGNAVTFPTS